MLILILYHWVLWQLPIETMNQIILWCFIFNFLIFFLPVLSFQIRKQGNWTRFYIVTCFSVLDKLSYAKISYADRQQFISVHVSSKEQKRWTFESIEKLTNCLEKNWKFFFSSSFLNCGIWGPNRPFSEEQIWNTMR